MRNTLLAKVLDTLSNTEREEWLRYVHSDCYCTSVILRELATHLHKEAFNWDVPATGKETTWRQLLPERLYREASLNNYISDLLQLTYDFLGQQQYLKQQDLQYELKIEQLLDRNLLKPAQRLYRKWVQQSSQARGAEADGALAGATTTTTRADQAEATSAERFADPAEHATFLRPRRGKLRRHDRHRHEEEERGKQIVRR